MTEVVDAVWVIMGMAGVILGIAGMLVDVTKKRLKEKDDSAAKIQALTEAYAKEMKEQALNSYRALERIEHSMEQSAKFIEKVYDQRI